MKQKSFATICFELLIKRKRKREFLDKMEPVVHWADLAASVRAKVEHQFRFIKLRYKRLAKKTAQLVMLLTLCNLWMTRKPILRRAQE